MNEQKAIRLLACALLVFSFIAVRVDAATSAPGDSASGACAINADATFPQAAISNGAVNAVLYLPNAETGYYRAVRFDWSGAVACLAYKGHTYFGPWSPPHDPSLHDVISGPVEEFRSSDGDSSINYDHAKPGEPFIKIGVGLLRKIDDSPYKIATPYPLIDGGKWTVRTGPAGVSFQQVLKSAIGFAYVYKKTVELDKHQPVLILHHELKNTGTQTIDTLIYDHDFFVIDNTPTGPDMVVKFPFELKPAKDLTNGARVESKQITYTRELETGQTAMSGLTGFTNNAAEYDFIVENQATGVGVEQTGDQPLARINFWSVRNTIGPEGYINIKVAPGQTAHWTIRYRFYAK